MSGKECVGAVVCKLESHKTSYQGYIAMLAVNSRFRGKGLGTQLVEKSINTMREYGCNEVKIIFKKKISDVFSGRFRD